MRGVLIAAALLLLAAPVSLASAPRKRELRTYTGLRFAVKHRFSERVPGRNIRRYGILTAHGSRPATAVEVGRSIRTFRRWLAPPMGRAKPGDRIAVRAASAGGRWAIPAYIVRCESHGNYNAVGPGKRDRPYGAYQIKPSTAGWYGCDLSTPAGQDICAARIYAREGASPWACG